MAPHVLPMLLDKLSSEVSTAKEASLKALVAGVRAFGAPGVGMHLRAVGGAMFEEVCENFGTVCASEPMKVFLQLSNLKHKYILVLVADMEPMLPRVPPQFLLSVMF